MLGVAGSCLIDFIAESPDSAEVVTDGAGLVESDAPLFPDGLLVALAVALAFRLFAGVPVFLFGLFFAGASVWFSATVLVFLSGLFSAVVLVFLSGLFSAAVLVFLSGLHSAGLLVFSCGFGWCAGFGFLGERFAGLGLAAGGGVGGGAGRAT